jgi:hypothetical protein
MPEIQVDWYSREEAERLRDLRDRHGMIWRGVLLEGAKHAESIDLLKALLELHPALAESLPGEYAGIGPERTVVVEQLREQILERQRARETIELPPSAFIDDSDGDEADGADAEANTNTDADGATDEERIDVSAAVEQIQKNRSSRPKGVQRPVAAEQTRAREYQQWDVRAARAVQDDETLHPLDAHEDVEDALRHPDDDEWDVVDPRYDYDDYAREYDGDYR